VKQLGAPKSAYLC